MASQSEVTIAAKKIDARWEAAVISKGRFVGAKIADDLYELVRAQLVGFLSADRPDGTTVSVNVSIVEKDEEEGKQ